MHRDVKPANILFDEAGHPFLSDFGIATAIDHMDSEAETIAVHEQLTSVGSFVGSHVAHNLVHEWHKSPEAARMLADADKIQREQIDPHKGKDPTTLPPITREFMSMGKQEVVRQVVGHSPYGPIPVETGQ